MITWLILPPPIKQKFLNQNDSHNNYFSALENVMEAIKDLYSLYKALRSIIKNVSIQHFQQQVFQKIAKTIVTPFLMAWVPVDVSKTF